MLAIKIETPRSVGGDPNAIADLQRRAHVALTQAAVQSISDRVFRQGKPVDRPKQYSRKKRPLVVSPRYPFVNRGATQTVDGKVVYPGGSPQFRAGIKLGTYLLSGGMRDGLRVVAGYRSSRGLFRGRSEGQDPGKRGRGKRVSNALKAKTVFATHGVNVMKVTNDEVESMAALLSDAVGKAVQQMLDMDLDLTNRAGARSILEKSIAKSLGL